MRDVMGMSRGVSGLPVVPSSEHFLCLGNAELLRGASFMRMTSGFLQSSWELGKKAMRGRDWSVFLLVT